MVDLVRLGIFDSDISVEQVQSIYRAMEVGAELEKRWACRVGFTVPLRC